MQCVRFLLKPCRFVRCLGNETSKISVCAPNVLKGYYFVLSKESTIGNMSQRSITSFFTKTPSKSIGTTASEKKSPEIAEKQTKESKQNGETNKEDKKRQRIESSESESESPKKGPLKEENAAAKRQRLVSSESEESSPIKKSPTDKRKTKRQRIESSSSESAASPVKVKVEKTTPAKEPKAKKKQSPLVVEKKVKKEGSSEKAPLTEVKDNIVKKEKDVDEKKEVGTETEKVAEADYDPSIAKYHPVRDACWAAGQPVPYLALARTLDVIEGTSSRLRMIEILSNYFRSVLALTPEDLLPSVYLCLNKLAPAYHGVELGMADMYLMKAIGQSTGRTMTQLRASAQKTGDLGLVAEEARASQRLMFPRPPLVLRKVFAALKEVALMTGQASVNKKIAKIQTLYVACRQSEAKFLIRSLAGKLRVGLAEQSLLQALALAATNTPPPCPPTALDAAKGLNPDDFKAKVEENALTIKTTYCECPNYDEIIPVLISEGVEALPGRCRLAPGVPLKPMLAHPTKGISEVFDRFEGVEFTCEWKYDGERAQIHVPEGGDGRPDLANASIFSRNQENNTGKYPDVLARLPALLGPGVRSCILDCEAVAYDPERKLILPFQVLSTRRRKAAAAAPEGVRVQVCVFVFDVLLLNGEGLVKQPLRERRGRMRTHLREVEGEWRFAESMDCSSVEEVASFLEASLKGSCEGLMVKTLAGPHATYEIARRSRNWLKLKKDYLDGVGDTIDAVVLGAYFGKGKRKGLYGTFLLACYDPQTEEFQSLCKIGTGFSDQQLQEWTESLKPHVIDQPKSYYRYDSSHTPDVWLAAARVMEVRCADLSLSPAHRAAIGAIEADKGVSLRFPRFVRARDDKTAEQATSAQQIADMYLAQDQVKNTAGSKQSHQDDFY